MPYCDKCEKGFETEETLCPACSQELRDEGDLSQDEFVSLMLMMGML